MSQNGSGATTAKVASQPSAGVIEMPRRQLVLVTVGVMLALLLAALDQTIVGTAMPRIIAELNGFDRYAWVTTAYLLTSTITVPIAGKLGDLFGRKPFILAGMAGFMAMSWLCGFSQNMTELIVFRGAQGLFGGVLFASVFTVLADIFTPQTRARMQGVFGGVFGLASIIGPTAGGFITDNWGWRWVFYVNIPVGVLGIAMLAMFLPFVRTKASWRNIDFAGAGLLALGLTPILIALSSTTTYGWSAWQTLVPLIGGILVLLAFIVVETREEEPIVPIGLFKNRAYAVSILVGFIMSFGMFGTIIFVPLIYQGVLGISATNSGALITPLMFGLIGASIATGQLMVRIKRYQYLGTLGAAITVVGMYFLSLVTVHSTQLEVTASLVLVGIGLGVTMPLYIQAVQSAVDRKFLGVVTSNIQFFRNVGGTIATAIFGSILASRLTPNIKDAIAAAHLPASFTSQFKVGGGSAQQIFNPTNLAAARAAVPAAVRPLFDQAIIAVKAGLAVTLHEMFLIGAVAMLISLVVSLFMPTVPLLAAKKQPGANLGEGSPVAETDEPAQLEPAKAS
ncbi:MAG TPA: MDR family MFS transporter [Candidatus Dormibacteraeota bacterium]|nr:MDR family MFS transporter [Candidatus Dormibacteraeota bacterium]